MKIKTIVLIILFIVIGVACFYFFTREEIKESADYESSDGGMSFLKVKNTAIERTETAEGIVVSSSSEDIRFDIDGLLEAGEIKLEKGARFKKNQLLYQINNSEVFSEMLFLKKKLKNELKQLFAEIESGFPSEKDKWYDFEKAIEPAALLPDFPEFKSSGEKKLMGQGEITQLYNQIKNYESGMSSYFFIAPFDGMIVETYVKTGQKISKREKVASIAKNGKKMIHCVLGRQFFHAFDTIQASYVLFNGKKETVKLLKVEENAEDEDALDLYYTADFNVSLGAKVSVELEGKTEKKYFRIPATAVKGAEVMVLEHNTKFKMKAVSVLSDFSDSVYVVGLENDEQIVLH